MRRFKKTIMFFALSLAFALISLELSGAISWGRLERRAIAQIAEDSNGFLKLEGLDNGYYDINNKFSKVGAITNNSNQVINLTVTIIPSLLLVNTKNYKLGIRIGNKVVNFNRKSDTVRQIELQLSPGQSVDIEASGRNKQQAVISTSFSFTATDEKRSYTLQLNDDMNTPRRIICY